MKNEIGNTLKNNPPKRKDCDFGSQKGPIWMTLSRGGRSFLRPGSRNLHGDTPWSPFCSFLAPFGLHLGRFWPPVASILLHFDDILTPFWYPSGSILNVCMLLNICMLGEACTDRFRSFLRFWSCHVSYFYELLSPEAPGPKTWVGGTPEGITIPSAVDASRNLVQAALRGAFCVGIGPKHCSNRISVPMSCINFL